MDAIRFDRLTRRLSGAISRRRTLQTLALGALGITMPGDESLAGPGCKNVGKSCQKKKACCSGICKGKKGKKRCKAHDASGCRAGQHDPDCGGTASIPCTSSAGQPGVCQTTTGKAGFCAASQACVPCSKDADCRPFCGPAAACLSCLPDCAGNGGTACAGPETCVFQ